MNEPYVASIIEQQPKSNLIALDIGANHGSYTRMLAERFGIVYAFEPHPTNVTQLNEVAKTFPNVIVMPIAITVATGPVDLFTNSNDGGHSISEAVAEAGTWGHRLHQKMTVDGISLDDFCADKQIAFIKMDIEGAENFVWQGATKLLATQHPKIVLETHQTVDAAALAEFFKLFGYRIFDNTCEVDTMIMDHHFYLEYQGI